MKLISFLFAALAILMMGSPAHSEHGTGQASTLPDLSGMTWIKDDCFLAVHDAKVSESEKSSYQHDLFTF